MASCFPQDTTFFIGQSAHRILKAAAAFTPTQTDFRKVVHLSDRSPVKAGPFTITPRLVDHSAYDSYALHVESAGQGLLYTGDLRAHGRKAATFEWLLNDRPRPVDALLMEGTTLQRTGTDQGFPSEADLEADLVPIVKGTAGLVLVWCSGQNIDRLVTVFRAAKRSGRQLILDLYAAHILEATGRASLPHAEWPNVRVYLPKSQKMRILRDESFELVEPYRSHRIHPEQLADVANHSVMLFRPGMCRELEAAGCLRGASFVYAMWDGYLNAESSAPVRAWLIEQGIPLHRCHTSGHASLQDLRRLRSAFADAMLVPIHTPCPDLYVSLFDDVVPKSDGQWWEIKDNAQRETRP